MLNIVVNTMRDVEYCISLQFHDVEFAMKGERLKQISQIQVLQKRNQEISLF